MESAKADPQFEANGKGRVRDKIDAGVLGDGVKMDKPTEILSLATAVFGSRHAAVAWLHKPAVGLAWQRPITLMQTPQGAALVETFLRRLEYS